MNNDYVIDPVLEKDKTFIIRLYKNADRIDKELEVLSQLYVKRESVIAEFLYRNGIRDNYILQSMKRKR